MADKLGLATISGLFAKAYRKGIAKDAYDIWQRIFRGVSNEDLEAAAWNLITNRPQYMKGDVRPDEITRELRDMGIYITLLPRHREDLVSTEAEEAEEEPVSLAEFRKMDKEGAKAIDSCMRRE